MADRKDWGVRVTRPPRQDVEDSKKKLTEEPLVRIPCEAPTGYRNELQLMRANSRHNIPMKSFMLEALDDLFDKYERGDGKFEMLPPR